MRTLDTDTPTVRPGYQTGATADRLRAAVAILLFAVLAAWLPALLPAAGPQDAALPDWHGNVMRSGG